jgi:Bacterial protein of unknown function (DUF899)
MNRPKVVSRDEWLAARKELLAKEKAHTRERDEINRQRRELPWVRIEKEYVFDAPEGKVTLADLFDGRSQLFIKHFMMGPGQVTQCVGCSLEVDHIEGLLVHLENHDVTYAVVARAPIEEIEAVRRRMGWNSPGYLPITRISTTISMSPGRATRLLPVARSTITGKRRNGQASWKISRATVCFIRTRPVRSSTPIQLSVAAAKSSSASTDFST